MRPGRRYPRSRAETEALFPEAVDVLLGGWGCPSRLGSADPFRIFLLSDADFRDLWRAHRPWLMAEAKRRGIAQPWGMQFDA